MFSEMTLVGMLRIQLEFQGIGRATALLFAKEGAKVVVSEYADLVSVPRVTDVDSRG